MSLFASHRGGVPMMNAYEIQPFDSRLDLSNLINTAQLLFATQKDTGKRASERASTADMPSMMAGHTRDISNRRMLAEGKYAEAMNKMKDVFETNHGGDIEAFLANNQENLLEIFSEYSTELAAINSQVPFAEQAFKQWANLYNDPNVMNNPMLTTVGNQVLAFGVGTDGEIGWYPLHSLRLDENEEQVAQIFIPMKGAQGMEHLQNNVSLGNTLMPMSINVGKGFKEVQEKIQEAIQSHSILDITQDNFVPHPRDPSQTVSARARQRVKSAEQAINNAIEFSFERISPEAKMAVISQIVQEGDLIPVLGAGIAGFDRSGRQTNDPNEIARMGLITTHLKDEEGEGRYLIPGLHHPEDLARQHVKNLSIYEVASMMNDDLLISETISGGLGGATVRESPLRDAGFFTRVSLSDTKSLDDLGLHGNLVMHTQGIKNENVEEWLRGIRDTAIHQNILTKLRNEMLGYYVENQAQERELKELFEYVDENPDENISPEILARIQEIQGNRREAMMQIINDMGDVEREFIYGKFVRAEELDKKETVSLFGINSRVAKQLVDLWRNDRVTDAFRLSPYTDLEHERMFYDGYLVKRFQMDETAKKAIRSHYGSSLAPDTKLLAFGKQFDVSQLNTHGLLYRVGDHAYSPRIIDDPNVKDITASVVVLVTEDMLKNIQVDYIRENQIKHTSLANKRLQELYYEVNLTNEEIQEADNRNYGNVTRLMAVPMTMILSEPNRIDANVQVLDDVQHLEAGQRIHHYRQQQEADSVINW